MFNIGEVTFKPKRRFWEKLLNPFFYAFKGNYAKGEKMSLHKEARKYLENRLKKKDFDFEGSLEEIIDKIDEWFYEYFNWDPAFRLEYDKKTNSIIICHYQEYEVFKVK